MSILPIQSCTAFAGTTQIARGPLPGVALAAKAAEGGSQADPLLIFDDQSGAVVDVDLRGSEAEVVARLEGPGTWEAGPSEAGQRDSQSPSARTRGRPKLGVVAREVTLLPRHWEWLAAQSGGASNALRRLVDQARRSDDGRTIPKTRREAAYRFLSAMAGNLPGYEEVIRALFAGDEVQYAERMDGWPPDVRNYALRLAAGDAPREESDHDAPH